MYLKILENYIESPLKIYEGGEPNHIFFKLKNSMGKIVGKVDLWNYWDTSNAYSMIDNISDLKEINDILNLQIDIDFGNEVDENIVFNLGNDDWVPVIFIKYKKKEDYVIAFILNERYPLRYQCYILAVLVVVHGQIDNIIHSSE